ncbi:hypothetical protein [Streptomyces albidoflavus]|uniref:hypothetical protein n=1 Tax=Streptomyces albidoflavus TaxID=1886 RepID=UPI0033E9F09B
MSDVSLAVHAAREGDGYWRSKGGQWSLLCPHMSSTAKVALGVLCSLTGQTHPVRNLTAAELAGLLSKGPVEPGEAPKAMSASGAIRVLRELAELGQITRPDGTRLTISSRASAEVSICVWTLPRHDCGCARNVHDALNALRGETVWFPPAGPGQNSHQAPESGQDSDQTGENSDQPGQNSAKTPPLTCDDASPSSLSSSSSSLSGPGSHTSDGAESVEGGGEREAATPETTPADAVVEAYVTASSRPVSARRKQALRKQAAALLAAGADPGWVAARAAEMPARGWTDLEVHCERWRAPEVPSQATAGSAGHRRGGMSEAERVARLRAMGSGL